MSPRARGSAPAALLAVLLAPLCPADGRSRSAPRPAGRASARWSSPRRRPSGTGLHRRGGRRSSRARPPARVRRRRHRGRGRVHAPAARALRRGRLPLHERRRARRGASSGPSSATSGRRRLRRHPLRRRHGAGVAVVPRARRRGLPRPHRRRRRQRAVPDRDDRRRGPAHAGHAAPGRTWTREEEWYSFRYQPARERARPAVRGRVDLRPARLQRAGRLAADGRPPDRLVPASTTAGARSTPRSATAASTGRSRCCSRTSSAASRWPRGRRSSTATDPFLPGRGSLVARGRHGLAVAEAADPLVPAGPPPPAPELAAAARVRSTSAATGCASSWARSRTGPSAAPWPARRGDLLRGEPLAPALDRRGRDRPAGLHVRADEPALALPVREPLHDSASAREPANSRTRATCGPGRRRGPRSARPGAGRAGGGGRSGPSARRRTPSARRRRRPRCPAGPSPSPPGSRRRPRVADDVDVLRVGEHREERADEAAVRRALVAPARLVLRVQADAALDHRADRRRRVRDLGDRPRRPIRRWISRRVRWRSSPKIHSAMRRRLAGSARSPKRTRCHHSSRMKFVSRGTPISGCMSSITCSSVVPDRGQPPISSGRPARPA